MRHAALLRVALAALALTAVVDATAAAPVEFTQQGRLLDGSGAPLDGSNDVSFRFYSSPAGGSAIWIEDLTLDFDNGFYSTILGELNPIDPDVFDGSTLYLGIAVNSGAELPTRIAIVSVPYAVSAGSAQVATSVGGGGTIDATRISVNGSVVIDSSGKISATSLPDLSDTLSDLDCSADQVARYNGSAWACAGSGDHDHLASDITSGTLDIARLPVGPTSGMVAAGDHTHSAADIGAYAVTNDGSTQVSAGRNCKQIHADYPSAPSGVYWLDPDNDGDIRDAWRGYCDMDRDGGGWTLILQNNRSVKTSVNPVWASTINAIDVRGGVVSDDLGSFDILVGLAEWADLGTSARVEVGAAPNTPSKQAMYTTFGVDASDKYKLGLSGQTITMGPNQPGIVAHNGKPWTTTDVDNDSSGDNCSNHYGHPWWYTACWNGSFWGSEFGHQPAAHWDGSGGDNHNWGAIWVR